MGKTTEEQVGGEEKGDGGYECYDCALEGERAWKRMEEMAEIDGRWLNAIWKAMRHALHKAARAYVLLEYETPYWKRGRTWDTLRSTQAYI